ncbi:glycosyltransferase family 1 protein [Natronoarchaeum mannanilyticum]|uniref:Uncharacterized protein n=1 Tax=Natronoarchaeum mannanilyticum TaxID=926360 RepID=A0AAV3TDP7_9EURY
MRVLLIPEVYRPEDATSSGTVRDAASWVETWLAADDSLHVYWLLPPRERARYDHEDVLADNERVTLIEARPFMADDPDSDPFTEGGYSEAELGALREAIFDRNGYVDVVVDQRRTGRTELYKWLLEHADQWAARVRPFDVIANVHDIQFPFKYRWCSYRNRYQFLAELCGALFADGAWYTAGIDAAGALMAADRLFEPDVVRRAFSGSVIAGSPIEFGRYEERYADVPRRLHVAGALWEKKHADLVLDVGRRLHDEFGIRTILTSMEQIPAEYRDRAWVDAFPEASRDTYERALGEGDLAICASEYETMARTPFEQAANGQVLLLRDEPWIYDCVPMDYALAVDADDLAALAALVVERWDEAVAENRRMVEHCRNVRAPTACGRRTYADLRRRIRTKRERYDAPAVTDVVERAAADVAEESSDSTTHTSGPAAIEQVGEVSNHVAIDDLLARTAEYTNGRPLSEYENVAFVDVIYALRSLGYEDVGNPGTPVFRKRGA